MPLISTYTVVVHLGYATLFSWNGNSWVTYECIFVYSLPLPAHFSCSTAKVMSVDSTFIPLRLHRKRDRHTIIFKNCLPPFPDYMLHAEKSTSFYIIIAFKNSFFSYLDIALFLGSCISFTFKEEIKSIFLKIKFWLI